MRTTLSLLVYAPTIIAAKRNVKRLSYFSSFFLKRSKLHVTISPFKSELCLKFKPQSPNGSIMCTKRYVIMSFTTAARLCHAVDTL